MDEKEPAGDHPAEKRISRYPPSFFLSAWLPWDGQKALPSRCLGRPRCRSTPAPAFRPPSLAAGETKCNARLPLPEEKRISFACCCCCCCNGSIEASDRDTNHEIDGFSDSPHVFVHGRFGGRVGGIRTREDPMEGFEKKVRDRFSFFSLCLN